VKAVMVPVPSIVLVLTPVEPAVVVVLVLVSCARAVPSASVQAAPAANILVNVFCFIVFLCLG
jgi:hypothetical protein